LPSYADDATVLAAKKRYHEAYFAEHEGVWCECPYFRSKGADILRNVL
jgi:hypothetical protein